MMSDEPSNDTLENSIEERLSIQVTKLESARRQLHTAVSLFFANGDEVSIHTLAAAARGTLRDLALREDRKSLLDQVIDLAPVDGRNDFRDRILEPQNFLKHAKTDPDRSLEFSPFITETFLWDAAWLYRVLSGEQVALFNLFSLWFVVAYPNATTTDEETKHAAREAAAMFDPNERRKFLDLLPEMERLGRDY